MPNWLIACYMFAVVFALFSIFLAVRLQQIYKHAVLAPFMYYVIFDNAQSVFDLFLGFLPRRLHWLGFQGKLGILSIMIHYFFIILAVCSYYFLNRVVCKLTDRPYSFWLARLFWGFFIPALAIFTVGLALCVGNVNVSIMIVSMRILDGTCAVYPVAVLIMGLFWTRSIVEKSNRRMASLILAIFLGAFCVFNFFPFLRSLKWLPLISYILNPFYAIFNAHLHNFAVLVYILPIIFLLQRHFKNNPAPVLQIGLNLTPEQYLKLGLSRREQEIVALVMQGRSNREIEDALFISCRTVENHIYKIYRKLGVSNRIQLVRLLQESGAAKS